MTTPAPLGQTVRPIASMASQLGSGDDAAIADEQVYKVTSNSELVVLRRVQLFGHKFYTFHDEKSIGAGKKSWYLDRRCQLTPKAASDIVKPVQKTVRPKKTWTITATVKGKGEPVTLFMFQLTWPRTWAAKGYTSFMFGFESQAEAQRWHQLFCMCIDKLRRSHEKRRAADPDGNLEALYRHSNTSLSNIADKDTTLDTKSMPPPVKVANHSGLGDSTDVASPSRYYDAPDNDRATEDMLVPDRSDDSSDENDPDDDDDASAGMPDTKGLRERWIPHKQVNGLSVYYHNTDGEDCATGGEYMVSTVVQAPPSAVLEVLMHGSANTTILGPARKMDILECTRVDDNTTRELVRLIIEAPGWAGFFCAPREMIVERMCKTDEKRSYVVIFNSSDDVVLRGQHCISKVVEEGSGQVTGRASRHCLWKKPILGSVSGTYAISCLKNTTLTSSSESLITCIVKVDLGGACKDHSWSGVMCDLFGWREAFLDRILMNVMLVRDEVEHRRFKAPQHFTKSAPSTVTLQPSHSPSTIRVGEPGSFLVPGARRMGVSRSKTMARRAPSTTSAGVTASGESSPSGRNKPFMPHLAGTDEQTNADHPEPSTPQAAEAGGHAVLDYELMARESTLERPYWSSIHTEGTDAPFSVRGPTYLKDKKKIPAGLVQFAYAAMDVIQIPEVVPHVARFLPSVRSTGMPFGIIINLVIPGKPLLGIVATFATEQHPAKVLCNPPSDPMEEGHNWQPFDFVMHKFYFGSDETRNKMLKLIPHIADGSWMIKSSVGTVPVILGKALKTTYHVTPQYIEVDIDISANNIASYVTGLVRGATKSLVIDMGFVLEGTQPWELPESLLGALRLNHLDISKAKPIDVSQELPLVPPRYVYDSLPDSPSAMRGTPGPSGLTPEKGSVEGNAQCTPGSTAGGTEFAASVARTGSMPSAQALAALGGADRPQGPGSVGGQSNTSGSTFGMRHRGHNRTRSNVDNLTAQPSNPQ